MSSKVADFTELTANEVVGTDDFWVYFQSEDGLTDYKVAKSSLFTHKKYRALLTQSGTNAPTAVVLENTLGGSPVLSYSGGGIYVLTLSGAFLTDKVFLSYEARKSSGVSWIVAYRSSDNTIAIQSYDSAGNLTDGIMSSLSFEINVYP